MTKLVFTVGVILTVLGVVASVTPMPGATLMAALGISMIICSSPRTALFIAACRRRFHRLNRVMTWIEGKTPKAISEALQRTRPTEPQQIEPRPK